MKDGDKVPRRVSGSDQLQGTFLGNIKTGEEILLVIKPREPTPTTDPYPPREFYVEIYALKSKDQTKKELKVMVIANEKSLQEWMSGAFVANPGYSVSAFLRYGLFSMEGVIEEAGIGRMLPSWKGMETRQEELRLTFQILPPVGGETQIKLIRDNIPLVKGLHPRNADKLLRGN